MAPIAATAARPVRLGLAENWRQFVLLLVVNACVGGMVGLERTVVPLIGAQVFHLATTALITSFIVSFGVAKALTNLVSGSLADRFGRKPVLLAGWLVGLPVPVLIMAAPNWGWIVAANVLLGVNQGLTWSMTVNMKIDLVGPTKRGLALGLNEFSGYASVGLTAFLTGAHRYKVWAASRPVLSRPRLCGSRSAALAPAGARHRRPSGSRASVALAPGRGPAELRPHLRARLHH